MGDLLNFSFLSLLSNCSMPFVMSLFSLGISQITLNTKCSWDWNHRCKWGEAMTVNQSKKRKEKNQIPKTCSVTFHGEKQTNKKPRTWAHSEHANEAVGVVAELLWSRGPCAVKEWKIPFNPLVDIVVYRQSAWSTARKPLKGVE